jgi:hypothetical protein
MTPPRISQGRLSSNIRTRRISIDSIIGFIVTQLEDFPTWRDVKPDQNENYYNQRLERLLQVRARKYCDAVQVGRESVYQTPGSHDVGVFPADEEGLVVRDRLFGPEQPIYTLECKRLLSTMRAERRREYLTSEKGEKPSGGVQRYKLCIHGAGLDMAGIVGYVQDEDLMAWRATINDWVGDLIARPVDKAIWDGNDRLRQHPKFKRRKKLLMSKSASSRIRPSDIRLTHFFVDLRSPRQPELALS